MKIIIAKWAGFCFGVKKAYETALATSNGEAIYSLGDLVHNSQVVASLENKGIKTVRNLEEINGSLCSTVLISAHGVPPEIIDEAHKKNLRIVDTTCSVVKRVQNLARELAQKGYFVVVIGDKDHKEVKGVIGWTGARAVVVENEKDIESIPFSKKIGIVVQTTQSQDNFSRLVEKILPKAKEVLIHNTICSAISKIQKDAIDLCKKVDIMLVIGDKKSANTRRLYELCFNTGTATYHIQNKKELDFNWFESKKTVGITAGSSTPDWIISEIAHALNKKEE